MALTTCSATCLQCHIGLTRAMSSESILHKECSRSLGQPPGAEPWLLAACCLASMHPC